MQDINDRRRFWPRVVVGKGGCWLWVGQVRYNGYGSFGIKSSMGKWTATTSHRFAYQDMVGKIPPDYEVDHLCGIRACVRPEHLEAVTVQENRRRRDTKAKFDIPVDLRDIPVIPPKPLPPPKIDRTKFCPRGHEYALVGKVLNGFNPDGKRRYTCSACRAKHYQKRRKGNAAKDRQSCPQGHPYEGYNLIARKKISRAGNEYVARECRICTYRRNNLRRKLALA